MTIEPETIVESALKQGWKMREHQPNICLLILQRGKEQMNVYYSKMTVATIVPHPKGKKQLFRKNVSLDQLIVLLRNPRTHTGKGYSTITRKYAYGAIEPIPGAVDPSFHPTDTENFYEREHFHDPEVTLYHQILNRRPRWWQSPTQRSHNRDISLALIHEFLYPNQQENERNTRGNK